MEWGAGELHSDMTAIEGRCGAAVHDSNHRSSSIYLATIPMNLMN